MDKKVFASQPIMSPSVLETGCCIRNQMLSLWFVYGMSFNVLYMWIFTRGLIKSLQILLQYYNSSLERDPVSKKIIKFGAVACIAGGVEANFSYSAPKIMYYSARGPDPQDNSFQDADILKPNLVAPGNSIWAAWSSGGTESVEFLGNNFVYR